MPLSVNVYMYMCRYVRYVHTYRIVYVYFYLHL